MSKERRSSWAKCASPDRPSPRERPLRAEPRPPASKAATLSTGRSPRPFSKASPVCGRKGPPHCNQERTDDDATHPNPIHAVHILRLSGGVQCPRVLENLQVRRATTINFGKLRSLKLQPGDKLPLVRRRRGKKGQRSATLAKSFIINS